MFKELYDCTELFTVIYQVETEWFLSMLYF